MAVKIAYMVIIQMIFPENSPIKPTIDMWGVFKEEGDFEMLGGAIGMVIAYILDYQAPKVYQPLEPFLY